MMIEVKKAGKTYGSKRVLEDVHLSIDKGACFGLLGPNGAGKSTLMKILAGIILDFEGDIQIENMSMRRDRDQIQHRIGYVPQEISLEEKLSAADNLRFFGRMHGLKGKELTSRMQEVLEMVGLSNRQHDKISTYSGGMKRRINIGCAMLHRPDILIIDEPTVGVDPHSRNYIFEMIRALKQEGTTILYSSHYMEEIQQLCDSLALIDQGRVVETGTIRDIRFRHAAPSIYVEAAHLKPEHLSSFGNVSKHGDGYVIETERALSAIHELAAWLQTKQIEPERLEITRPSLEDIFLQLTGSKLRDND